MRFIEYWRDPENSEFRIGLSLVVLGVFFMLALLTVIAGPKALLVAICVIAGAGGLAAIIVGLNFLADHFRW